MDRGTDLHQVHDPWIPEDQRKNVPILGFTDQKETWKVGQISMYTNCIQTDWWTSKDKT